MKIEETVISSRQNRTVVEAAKLTDRKEREATRCFRFDGVKLFHEALSAGVELPCILLAESRADAILRQAREVLGDGKVDTVERALILSDDLFLKLSEEKSPEGVICIAKYIDKLQKNATIYCSAQKSGAGDESVLLLESVRDPSNVGAIIRSAAAFGVDRLILSSDCADIYHPRAVRASMGTLFRQCIDRTDDLPSAIRALQATGRRVYAATLSPTAERLGELERKPGDCVVIGNEGHGVSAEVEKAADGDVIIPMSERAESLNAAVAASLFLWEFFGKFRR